MTELINNPFIVLILITLLGITAVILSVMILYLISKFEKCNKGGITKNLEELAMEEMKKSIEIWREPFKKTNQEAKLKISEALNQIIGDFKIGLADLNQEIKKEMSGFGQINASSRELLLKEAREAAEKFSQELKMGIENYKEERFKDIDIKIYQILGQVAKKTIGKAIDFSTHEELIMDALEKAKRENFFD